MAITTNLSKSINCDLGELNQTNDGNMEKTTATWKKSSAFFISVNGFFPILGIQLRVIDVGQSLYYSINAKP